MDFAAALAETASTQGPNCSIGKAIAGASPEVSAQIGAALADPAIQTAHLTRALALVFDVKFASQTVGRHRKGQCNCGA